MRKIACFLLVCVFSGSVFAQILNQSGSGQIPELDAIKKFSRDRIKEYTETLITNKDLIGAVTFAKGLQDLSDSNNITRKDISKLTDENVYYWRAAIEKTPRNSSVLFATAYLYAANGDISYADIYFIIGAVNADTRTRKELDNFMTLKDKLYVRLGKEISEGIKLHDEGQYKKAIEIYNKAIAKYPEYASFYYEKGLSYMMESRPADAKTDEEIISKSDPNLRGKALEQYKICRELDPFFWRAYQGNDPNVISKLKVFIEKVSPFYSGQKRDIESFKAFAEGCEQMELYSFAAHARLKLSLIDSGNETEHLDKFFTLIEKSGCKQANDLKIMFNLSQADRTKEKTSGKESSK